MRQFATEFCLFTDVERKSFCFNFLSIFVHLSLKVNTFETLERRSVENLAHGGARKHLKTSLLIIEQSFGQVNKRSAVR